jgi:DNA-binding phage protein
MITWNNLDTVKAYDALKKVAKERGVSKSSLYKYTIE